MRAGLLGFRWFCCCLFVTICYLLVDGFDVQFVVVLICLYDCFFGYLYFMVASCCILVVQLCVVVFGLGCLWLLCHGCLLFATGFVARQVFGNYLLKRCV